MARDTDWKVPLDFPGTRYDLKRLGIILRPGLRLILYTLDGTPHRASDDLIALGIVGFDTATGQWSAVIDPESMVHYSDLEEGDRQLYDVGRLGSQGSTGVDVGTDEANERIRSEERTRIAEALRRYFKDGPNSFRVLLEYVGLSYWDAMAEGWLDFNNAVAEHDDRLTQGEKSASTPIEVDPPVPQGDVAGSAEDDLV